MLLGRLRDQLVQRGRDPELSLQADWEEKEIRLPDERPGHDQEWLTFHMDQAGEESKSPRERAADMLLIALGAKDD